MLDSLFLRSTKMLLSRFAITNTNVLIIFVLRKSKLSLKGNRPKIAGFYEARHVFANYQKLRKIKPTINQTESPYLDIRKMCVGEIQKYNTLTGYQILVS